MASSSTGKKNKMVRLGSSDGESFEVLEEAIGAASGMIKGMLEEDCAAGVIPLPNVTAAVLSRVLDYVNKHFEDGDSFDACSDALAGFDDEFIKVDNNTILDIMLAGNYLNIPSLVDLACKAVAQQLVGKTPEEMRKHFNIVNDYTQEEEEELRRENAWAFQ